MLPQIKETIQQLVDKGYNTNPWTNIYGLARTFLAISLLLTLVFTGVDNLFPMLNGNPLKQPYLSYDKISIFYIMRDYLVLAWGISVIILLFVITGFFPQISGILHWWITYSYLVSGVVIEGGDQIASIITLFLIPVTISDNRINHWKNPIKTDRKKISFFIWSIYIMISLQISIIYFHAAVAKLFSKEWLNGTAAYYWFTHSSFGVPLSVKNIVSIILSSPFICALITWGTMIFEILLFGWIFISRNKWNWKLLFTLAVCFHFGIALIHGLVSFMFTMVGALILYFFPKELNLTIKNKTT